MIHFNVTLKIKRKIKIAFTKIWRKDAPQGACIVYKMTLTVRPLGEQKTNNSLIDEFCDLLSKHIVATNTTLILQMNLLLKLYIPLNINC